MFTQDIIETIHFDDIDLTWFEIQVNKRINSNKIISKSLLICQGDLKEPSIIFLTKRDVRILIKELIKILCKL